MVKIVYEEEEVETFKNRYILVDKDRKQQDINQHFKVSIERIRLGPCSLIFKIKY